MNIDAFKYDDWTKLWAGSWVFLTCSHFANQYTEEIRFGPMPFIEKSIILIKRGKSEGWARQSDRDKLGRYLADVVTKNENSVAELCSTFRHEVDTILAFIEEATQKEINESAYTRFWSLVLSYYQPHINVKYVVDYLEPSLLKRHIHALEEVRLYAEPVFARTEHFMNTFANQISRKTGYSVDEILCLTKDEIYRYFGDDILPHRTILSERYERTAILSVEKESLLLLGDEVLALEKLIHPPMDEGVVKGKSAYPGKVQGIVRIVPDPANPGEFNEGNVLVAGMTRPEYLSLMKKASAFVTDAGGVLSHAAIVAREMKKPAVIGTQIATKVFKDGDLVEVDAEKGVVTVVKRA